MASGAQQDPQIRPILTLAELHRGAVPGQVTADDVQREGWRRFEIRYYAGRVDELQRRLRRRTWILGGALALSLAATAVLAITTLLLPGLKPRTTAGPAAPADSTAPIPMLSAPEPTAEVVEPRRPVPPER